MPDTTLDLYAGHHAGHDARHHTGHDARCETRQDTRCETRQDARSDTRQDMGYYTRHIRDSRGMLTTDIAMDWQVYQLGGCVSRKSSYSSAVQG